MAQASLGVLYLFSLLYKKHFVNTTFWGIDPDSDPGACALCGHLAPLAPPSVLLGGLTPTPPCRFRNLCSSSVLCKARYQLFIFMPVYPANCDFLECKKPGLSSFSL